MFHKQFVQLRKTKTHAIGSITIIYAKWFNQALNAHMRSVQYSAAQFMEIYMPISIVYKAFFFQKINNLRDKNR